MSTFKFWTPSRIQKDSGSIVGLLSHTIKGIELNVESNSILINGPIPYEVMASDTMYVDDVLFSGTPQERQAAIITVFRNASGGESGGGAWGSITGSISSQTDLVTILNGKMTLESAATFAAISGSATKRFIHVATDESNEGGTGDAVYFHNGTLLKKVLFL